MDLLTWLDKHVVDVQQLLRNCRAFVYGIMRTAKKYLEDIQQRNSTSCCPTSLTPNQTYSGHIRCEADICQTALLNNLCYEQTIERVAQLATIFRKEMSVVHFSERLSVHDSPWEYCEYRKKFFDEVVSEADNVSTAFCSV